MMMLVGGCAQGAADVGCNTLAKKKDHHARNAKGAEWFMNTNGARSPARPRTELDLQNAEYVERKQKYETDQELATDSQLHRINQNQQRPDVGHVLPPSVHLGHGVRGGSHAQQLRALLRSR
jgi:hypothetical protein